MKLIKDLTLMIAIVISYASGTPQRTGRS